MLKQIIDKDIKRHNKFDNIVIHQDDKNRALIRISFLKDCHYQAEFFLNLDTDHFSRDACIGLRDWYFSGRGDRIDISFSYDNRYMVIDYDIFDNGKITARAYELEELYDNATT